jgi:SARP family transcriptional regulator, regulator of embCAB operon
LIANLDGRRAEEELDREERVLLAYLAFEHMRAHPREELVSAIWGEAPPADASDRLDAMIEKLRQVVGPARLVGRDDIRLALPGDAFIDLDAAREAIHRAEAAIRREEWTTAWPAARVGLHTSRGFLIGLEAAWITRERQRVHLLRIRALEATAEVGLGMGGYELTSTDRSARTLIDLEPFRESGYRYLMEALARTGNTAEAIRVYEALRVRLRDELGIEPSAETQAAYARLRGGAPAEAPAPARVERTFVFTDICGSTALVEAIGDEAWQSLVDWHDRTLRALFAEHGGEEVDHAGDGFFVAFDGPAPAVACAVAVQQRLAEHRRESGFAPDVRIGIHSAPASQAGGKYRGKGVHEAARIGALGNPREIVASRETVAGLDVEWLDRGSAALKGVSEPVDLVTIGW